ncbi:MAG: hypothetical protein K0R25_802 [Rickettsiaceae bacterium]|jgi:hypothetical protein|nr:hypothetical protein [Rickettsiaceae bacterium]
MSSLIKNPIFRIIGILVILYYGLFYNNDKPESLKARLAPEKIKSNLSDMSSKSLYIIENVKKAEEVNDSQTQNQSIPNKESEKDDKQ